jgi:hypothetical protein
MYIYSGNQLGQAPAPAAPANEGPAPVFELKLPEGSFWKDVSIAVVSSVLGGVALYLVMKHVK